MTSENSQTNAATSKLAGILFLLAGIGFFAAYVLGRQISFVGVGAAFLCIGTVFLAKSKKTFASE